uniref:Uncharacterized protein n=1 Tax=Meloidogyne incognita TaxID=6306 RepID=A0A914M8U0_MELIC
MQNLDENKIENQRIDQFEAEELNEIREFIKEHRKKKEISRRRAAAKTSSSSSTVSKAPKPKKAQEIKKISKNVFDETIKSITAKAKYEKDIDDEIENIINNDIEEVDTSDDPESDEVIDLGEDEAEYKRMRLERQRSKQIVPEALLRRAKVLKKPRSGIFIFQCNFCRESQKKRETFLFKSGHSEISVLTLLICAEDLDKNINLGMHYSSNWGESAKDHQTCEQTSTFNKAAGVLRFRRGESIAINNDKKLLNLIKFCWILHQCSQCCDHQNAMASDLFLQKADDKYELSFLVCSFCSMDNIEYQQKTYANISKKK